MSFTDDEVAYIRSQRLTRIATVSSDGQPDVVPVGFEFDGSHFYIGGLAPEKTRRARNVRGGNTKVALVIDDLKSVDPWSPRSVRVYGSAELVQRTNRFGTQEVLKVTPEISWSVNLSGDGMTDGDSRFTSTRIVHDAPPASDQADPA